MEHLWVQGNTEVPLSELTEETIKTYIENFRWHYKSWEAFPRRWRPIFEAELVRRKMTPENLEICNTSFMLDQIIKKKEEEQFHKPVVGWKGFSILDGVVERELSKTDNRVVIERITGLMLSGAKATWDSHRMEAHCLDYAYKPEGEKTRKLALDHIKGIGADAVYCKCGLYCYFDKNKCVQEHEFEVVAKVTGWGTVGWASDGARCSDMRIEQVWIVKDVFAHKYGRDSFMTKYLDFDRMVRDLSVLYNNEIDVCWVESIKDIPE